MKDDRNMLKYIILSEITFSSLFPSILNIFLVKTKNKNERNQKFKILSNL